MTVGPSDTYITTDETLPPPPLSEVSDIIMLQTYILQNVAPPTPEKKRSEYSVLGSTCAPKAYAK